MARNAAALTHLVLAACLLLLIPGGAQPTPALLAAVLPSSRSVQVGTAATAFVSIINAGTATATGCRPSLHADFPATFTFQTTDAQTNAVVGVLNAPADIGPGASQSFVVALVPTAPILPTQAPLTFACLDAGPAPSIIGVNSLLLSASIQPASDIVAVPATLNADGVLNIPGPAGAAALAIAAINLGAADTITTIADTGSAALPITLSLCRTALATSTCVAPETPAASVTTPIGVGEAAAFAVFGSASGDIPFAPATSRIFVRFVDESGLVRGSASVAVRTLAPPTTPPTSSGAALITPDGGRVLALNVEAGSVAVIDTAAEAQVADVPVGPEPRSLAASPDWRRLYVTLDDPPSLAVLDVDGGAVIARIPVGADPYGVVTDPHGDLAYVASSALDRVEVVHIGLRRVIAVIPVGPRPKGLALSADASRLLVTHFFSGQVSLIDTTRRAVLGLISTGADSNMAQKVAIHPVTGRAHLPHIRSNTSNKTLLFDSTIFPVLSAVDPATLSSVSAERVDLSLGEHSVNLPTDVAFSPNGSRAYIANRGSGDLSVVDLPTRRKVTDIDVGDGPSAVVVAPDGARAFVVNTLSENLSVVDLVALRETRRIPLTTGPLPAGLKRGKLLFFSSREREVSKERWMSCASCHFGGDHDGRTWFFAGRGPRNTTSLRGSGQTRPLHWSADRDEVQDFELTIRELQAGTGLLRDRTPHPPLGTPNAGRSADLDLLAAFVESLQPKASPFLARDGSLTAAARRGETVFLRTDVGCAGCHPSPRFTDSTPSASPIVHDVGTGDDAEEEFGPAFDAPSLRGLWDSAPYLHDGSAPTLRAVVTTRNPGDRHGRTSHLSQGDLEDLIAYLRSL
jgi:YVTN family beta-propeller protein